MHKAYEEEMNRKAHRYALLKAAKENPAIHWERTAADWTVLKASDTGTSMLVSVKVEVDRDRYFELREMYERAQKAREAKKNK
jgi:hypothetical protein